MPDACPWCGHPRCDGTQPSQPCLDCGQVGDCDPSCASWIATQHAEWDTHATARAEAVERPREWSM